MSPRPYSATVTLVSFQHVWRSNGTDYDYHCVWSDGSKTREFTLPWGRMDGAVELPMTSRRELERASAVTLNSIAAMVSDDILGSLTMHAAE